METISIIIISSWCAIHTFSLISTVPLWWLVGQRRTMEEEKNTENKTQSKCLFFVSIAFESNFFLSISSDTPFCWFWSHFVVAQWSVRQWMVFHSLCLRLQIKKGKFKFLFSSLLTTSSGASGFWSDRYRSDSLSIYLPTNLSFIQITLLYFIYSLRHRRSAYTILLCIPDPVYVHVQYAPHSIGTESHRIEFELNALSGPFCVQENTCEQRAQPMNYALRMRTWSVWSNSKWRHFTLFAVIAAAAVAVHTWWPQVIYFETFLLPFFLFEIGWNKIECGKNRFNRIKFKRPWRPFDQQPAFAWTEHSIFCCCLWYRTKWRTSTTSLNQRTWNAKNSERNKNSI